MSEKTDKKRNHQLKIQKNQILKIHHWLKKRGKKSAENPSTKTGNAPEPAAKRPRVASKRNTISTEEPATASTEHVDIGI